MEIEELVRYKNWADEIYIQYCRELSERDFEREISGYKNSIKTILGHMFEVCWYWYHRITDQKYEDEPDIQNLTKNQIIDGLMKYNTKIMEYTTKKDIYRKFTIQWEKPDKPVDTTAEEITFNFVSHSAYHRCQLAIYLRITGVETIIETDFNPYRYQMGQQ